MFEPQTLPPVGSSMRRLGMAQLVNGLAKRSQPVEESQQAVNRPASGRTGGVRHMTLDEACQQEERRKPEPKVVIGRTDDGPGMAARMMKAMGTKR